MPHRVVRSLDRARLLSAVLCLCPVLCRQCARTEKLPKVFCHVAQAPGIVRIQFNIISASLYALSGRATPLFDPSHYKCVLDTIIAWYHSQEKGCLGDTSTKFRPNLELLWLRASGRSSE